jgi:UDP-N-acetylmuramate dehydrogenase
MTPFQEHIPLEQFTTIRLGGPARYFVQCRSTEELKEVLSAAASQGIRVHILGGGSNTIFSDEGFNGLIVKVGMKGISFAEDGSDVVAEVKAGEDWDAFVAASVENGYGGIECLSGIPGSVGATPIQNVGAYGQEVKDTIESVSVLDRKTLTEHTFSNEECRFSYRTSRLKSEDAGRYIVTAVTFRLKKNGRPVIQYPEVKKIIDTQTDLSVLKDGRESLTAVRSIVLALRAKKSMVLDPNDPNTRSVGSFFLNPIVDDETLTSVRELWSRIGDGTAVPVFPFGTKNKIPAAWLIERSGFKKGLKKNGVGISEHHTLALVNYDGTTSALLALAREVQAGVNAVFRISLELEANVIT